MESHFRMRALLLLGGGSSLLGAIRTLGLLGTSSLLCWALGHSALSLFDDSLDLVSNGRLLRRYGLLLGDSSGLSSLGGCSLGTSLSTGVCGCPLLCSSGGGLGDGREDSWPGVSGRRSSSFSGHRA